MRTIGFPISDKENENRRAILPTDLMKIRLRSHISRSM